MECMKGILRREFLKIAGAASLSGFLAACNVKLEDESTPTALPPTLRPTVIPTSTIEEEIQQIPEIIKNLADKLELVVLPVGTEEGMVYFLITHTEASDDKPTLYPDAPKRAEVLRAELVKSDWLFGFKVVKVEGGTEEFRFGPEAFLASRDEKTGKMFISAHVTAQKSKTRIFNYEGNLWKEKIVRTGPQVEIAFTEDECKPKEWAIAVHIQKALLNKDVKVKAKERNEMRLTVTKEIVLDERQATIKIVKDVTGRDTVIAQANDGGILMPYLGSDGDYLSFIIPEPMKDWDEKTDLTLSVEQIVDKENSLAEAIVRNRGNINKYLRPIREDVSYYSVYGLNTDCEVKGRYILFEDDYIQLCRGKSAYDILTFWNRLAWTRGTGHFLLTVELPLTIWKRLRISAKKNGSR